MDVAAAAPVAFFVGLLVGLGLSSRYRIIRINGRKPPDDPEKSEPPE